MTETEEKRRLDRTAGILLIVIVVVVTIADDADTIRRNELLPPLSFVEWAFGAVTLSLAVTAAFVLPLQLKGVILLFHMILFMNDARIFGPIDYSLMLVSPKGLDHDLFFEGVLFIAQTLLLIGYSFGAALRLAF